MNYRDLEKVRQIIDEATGLEVTYAYDDLVFPEHMAFLMRFDDTDLNKLYCYFHKDCVPEEQKKIVRSLVKCCSRERVNLDVAGIFDLEQKGDTVDIKFL